MDPSDGPDGLGPDEVGRPDATEVELVPVGEPPRPSARTTGVNRKHAAIAGAAVLLSAILISRAGEEVPTATALRTADFSGPELTAADNEDDEADESQSDEYTYWLDDEDAEALPFDEYALTDDDFTINTFESYEPYDTTDSFEDFSDFEDFGDYDTLPRRSSSTGNVRPTRPQTTPPRPRPAGTPGTTTTSTSTTTSTIPEDQSGTVPDSTTTTSTTTSTTTTTTTVPVAKWEPATTGLTCMVPVNVWVRNDLLVASVGMKLFTSADAGQTWTERQRADVGVLTPVAVVQRPALRDQFWVATNDGVFEAADSQAPLIELGNLATVHSLALDDSDPSQTSLLAVADSVSTLYRWTSANPDTWQARAPLPPGTTPGELAVLGGRVFLGTDRGVFELADNETSWLARTQQAVKGAPVTLNGVSYWLLTDGGVIKNTGGADWATVTSGAASPRPNGAAGLTAATGPGLVTTGGSGLIASSDGGANWAALPETPPFGPTGISYSTNGTLFIWRSDCAVGAPPTTFIMKLAGASS